MANHFNATNTALHITARSPRPEAFNKFVDKTQQGINHWERQGHSQFLEDLFVVSTLPRGVLRSAWNDYKNQYQLELAAEAGPNEEKHLKCPECPKRYRKLTNFKAHATAWHKRSAQQLILEVIAAERLRSARISSRQDTRAVDLPHHQAARQGSVASGSTHTTPRASHSTLPSLVTVHNSPIVLGAPLSSAFFQSSSTDSSGSPSTISSLYSTLSSPFSDMMPPEMTKPTTTWSNGVVEPWMELLQEELDGLIYDDLSFFSGYGIETIRGIDQQ